jgi:transcriptional regulator with XRE-family HTH domain
VDKITINEKTMVTAGQLRAARALIGIDQRELAALSSLSVPTIQRMEASDGVIRGNVDSLMKLIGALDAAGIELIPEGALSQGGGRGVRLKLPRADGKAYRRKPPRLAGSRVGSR